MFECEPTENHVILLIKAIAEKYLQERYHYAAKHYTFRNHMQKGAVSRQVHTKLILFS
ncbi:hypothetical protein Bpfe_005638, partial [Biomphalaria pfeifferi]